MKTLGVPSALPELGVRASGSAPVIIATDGRTQSDAALVVGRLLAGAPDALRLVTVLKAMPSVPEGQITVTPDLLAARRAEARREAIEQMRRMWDDEYRLELREGDPATVVSHLAHEAGATMIVCGLGRHRVSDRMFGDETALRLIRMSDVPVFAVATTLNHAPRRIVVAVDFSETSLRAARLTLEVASAGATIYLTHVAPRDSALADWRNWGTAYKQDAGAALQKTRDALRIPKNAIVQNVLLQGDPSTELLAFATSVNADLIATGSHGHGFVARMLIGSVTTRIVRCSTCSVLTVPHAAAMTRARTVVAPAETTTIPVAEWAGALEQFTRRNAGRQCTLEADDPDLNAQAQAFDYPLLSVSCDGTGSGSGSGVVLEFGNVATGQRQLTRSVNGATAIAVLRDESGRDLALRIANGVGLTLLTFPA